MAEHYFPDEAELDALLKDSPALDHEAVKRQTLSKIKKGKVLPMKKKPLIRIVVIAALICILSVSALAVTNFALDGRIASFLGIGAAQTESLKTAGSDLNLTSENAGTTMKVLQTLGDSNTLYVLVQFTFPENVKLRSDMTFNRVRVEFPGSKGYSWSVLSEEGQTRTYLLDITTKRNLTGKKLTLTFSNFGYHETPNENGSVFINVVGGDWTQTWELNYKDTSRTFQVRQNIAIAGQSIKVDSIRISPLSITLSMNTQKNIVEASSSDYLPAIMLRYRDGSETVPLFNGSCTAIEGGDINLQLLFNKVVDVDNITAIVLNGTEIPLK